MWVPSLSPARTRTAPSVSHKQLARSSACGVLRIQNPTFLSISAVFLSRLLSPSEIKGPIPRANAAISGGQPKPCDASVDQFEYMLPLFWVVACVFAVCVPSDTCCFGRTRRRLREITEEKCSEKHFRATTHHRIFVLRCGFFYCFFFPLFHTA